MELLIVILIVGIYITLRIINKKRGNIVINFPII